MDSYEDFAYVYDELMDETPYEIWKRRIVCDVEKYGITKRFSKTEDALESERNLVLDLGCGTGTLTQMLYEEGFDMIGVDSSEAMLCVAMEKREETGSNILYLLQDMRELELYSTIGTVISVCDSLNYILEKDELNTVFSLVHNYLYPGGLFIFDFNTDYKYREIIGDSVIAENREDCSFIWENYYDPDTRINEYDLTVFAKEDEEDVFRRFQETHLQKGYFIEEICDLLKSNSFEILKMIDAEQVDEDCEMARAVAPQGGEITRDAASQDNGKTRENSPQDRAEQDDLPEKVQRVYVVAKCIK